MKKRKILRNTIVALGTVCVINEVIYKVKQSIAIEEANYFHSNYGKVKYNVYGEGKPLLLIHDFNLGASSYQWSKNIDTFVEAGYKVYTLDLVGYGESDKPNLTYNSYLYVSLINKFIEVIIKEPTNVIGLGLASNYIQHAKKMNEDLFDKVVLVNPTTVFISSDGNANLNNVICKSLELPIISDVLYHIFSSKKVLQYHLENKLLSPFSFVSESRLNQIQKMAYIDGRKGKYAYKYFISRKLNVPVNDSFADIENTLVVYGEDNTFFEYTSGYEELEQNENIELYKVSNAKIYPNIESHTNFNERVIQFLNKK